MKNKKYFRFLLFGLLFLVIAELVLRFFFGFCDTVLMQESSTFEYIPQPNQSRYRFGRDIVYNSLSMRSEELDSSAVKILCFGDSVINGGVLTDQDSLATMILDNRISNLYAQKVQFLNISAGSWGPDNGFAYLKEYGNFGAKLILLFVSSHDAYDTMNFEKVVDNHKSFPSHQYFSAIYELLDRYLIPRLIPTKDDSTSTDELGINKKKEESTFNPGFKQFIEYSKQQHIPLIVYLHAEKSELKSSRYNEQGQEIMELLNANSIPLLTDLNSGLEVSDYRDKIHLNEKGQRNIVSNVFNMIEAKQFAFFN